ncbi:FecCD family ABC transporter permease [Eubacterium oxidoreducens]|uniref:Probable heme-iron transport system permease protein IsdF n=1 Tax=Eubacterium oxidoreducens TaxID=1732 RepID=A0A1G6A346_EUBOX|nr:iron ABC transporter permease [Eubacterium oxidoreducens]SDB02862.1 iron complex transport system permease protein [Eubacterium oxidoreducens]
MEGNSVRIERKDYETQRKKAARSALAFALLALMLVALVFASANIGSLRVGVGQMFRGLFLEYDADVYTIFDLRFPRIAISLLAGAAFSVAGVLFQAVLKNPLADPGIIGISGGAGCFSILLLCVAPGMYAFSPLFACLGGVVAFALVYALSWKGGLSPLRIILVGIAIDAFFTGLVNAVDDISGSSSSVASIVEGNITQMSWDDAKTLAPYVIIGLISASIVSGRCNLLALEDKTARGLGMNVYRQRLIISFIAVILASISTAVVGSISFLGLIVPHLGRLLVGSEHGKLIPFSMMLGAFIFLGADTIGRSIAYPYEISASVIMCIVGGPFFVFMLRRSNSYGK